MVRKSTIHLEANELNQIKSFYEQERMQLASRLNHIDQVIARLSGSSSPILDPAEALAPAKATRAKAPSVSVAASVKRGPGRPRKEVSESEARVKKAGRPKKRGPKSIWGNFILRRLRQCDRPLSYSELVRDAMVLNNLPAEKAKNAKASVLNAAFRLRNSLNKVDTVGLPGKKEKFLVLSSWMAADGTLKAPYQDLFKAVAETPMDDRGRKPRRPSESSEAETKVKARMKVSPKEAKPVAKKAPATKTASKPAKAASAKPAAKKAPAARKAVAKAKPAAKKAPAARKTVAKAKPAAKKAPAARKTVAKATKKTSPKRTSTKKTS